MVTNEMTDAQYFKKGMQKITFPKSIIKKIKAAKLSSVTVTCTQTFEKWGANLRGFTMGDANLKKNLIFRPKLGV